MLASCDLGKRAHGPQAQQENVGRLTQPGPDGMRRMPQRVPPVRTQQNEALPEETTSSSRGDQVGDPVTRAFTGIAYKRVSGWELWPTRKSLDGKTWLCRWCAKPLTGN